MFSVWASWFMDALSRPNCCNIVNDFCDEFIDTGICPDQVLKISSTSKQKFKINSFHRGVDFIAFSVKRMWDNSRNSIFLSS